MRQGFRKSTVLGAKSAYLFVVDLTVFARTLQRQHQVVSTKKAKMSCEEYSTAGQEPYLHPVIGQFQAIESRRASP